MPEDVYNGIKVTLLSQDEYIGDRMLGIFKKKGNRWKDTDFSIISGGTFVAHKDEICKPGRIAFKDSSDNHEVVVYCRSVAKFDDFPPNYSTNVYRPVLQLSKEMFDKIVGIDEEEVTFGYYLTNAADKSISKKLSNALFWHELAKSGDTYTFATNHYDDSEKLESHEVYEYEGQRYCHVKANFGLEKDYTMKCLLSNKGLYRRGDYIWVKEEPIEWWVDRKTKKLICKNALIGGLEFDHSENYYGKFDGTSICEFFNTTFLKELVQHEPLLIPEKNEREEELNGILDEIKFYMKYSLSDTDIAGEVDTLFKQYEKDRSQLESEFHTPEIELVVGYYDLDSLYNNLKDKLIAILDRLKLHAQICKKYHDVIDILDGTNKEDELGKFLEAIKTIINTTEFLKDERVSLLSSLNEVLASCICRLNDYIKECEFSKSDAPNKTIDELKHEVRSDLHPFLERLNETVEKRDVVNEILIGIKAIVENNYKETNNQRAKFVLDMVSETVSYIRKNGTAEDLVKLQEATTFSIDFSKDILSILKDLNDVFKNAYKVKLDVMERETVDKKFDRHKFKINVMERLKQ